MRTAGEVAKCLLKLFNRLPEDELLSVKDRSHSRLDRRSHSLVFTDEIQQGYAHAELLDYAKLSAAVHRPSRFTAPRIRGHFLAKTNGLDASAAHSLGDQCIAHGLRPLFPEAAIIFLRASFICEAGNDQGIAH